VRDYATWIRSYSVKLTFLNFEISHRHLIPETFLFAKPDICHTSLETTKNCSPKCGQALCWTFTMISSLLFLYLISLPLFVRPHNLILCVATIKVVAGALFVGWLWLGKDQRFVFRNKE
jgi:hypothetical protein